MTEHGSFELSRRDLLRGVAGASALSLVAAACSPGDGGGTPGVVARPWHVVRPASRDEVAGYVSRPSLDRGQVQRLHLNCWGPDAELPVEVAVHRTGWYGGDGARTYLRESVLAPPQQPLTAVVDPATNLCRADWAPVLSFDTATDGVPWPSGVYLVQLTASSGRQSYVPFTLRDDRSQASILVVQNHLTWQAYNTCGFHDLYHDGSAVSFQRPYKHENMRASFGAGEYLWLEYRIVRWLEREGFDVTYVADFDLHRAPVPESTKVILLGGHPEYWTHQMRTHVEASMSSRGVGLVALGANTCYWRGRLEGATADAPGDYVLHKTLSGQAHPADPLRTDPILASRMYRTLPGGAEQRLLGGQFRGWVDLNDYDGPLLSSTALVADDTSHPVFEGTGITRGERFDGLCGGEYDWQHPDHPTAPGVKMAFTTPLDWLHSSWHDMTRTEYQQSALHEKVHPGGATSRVFNAGTYTWAWGLDDFSLEPHRYRFADERIQALTANILRWAAKEL
jgi:hypothetical protein